jgi:hypothetical protein
MDETRDIGTQNKEDGMDNVIYKYTAEQAIEDGTLVDVTELAKEAGFNWPVRITALVHTVCIPPKTNKIESYKGRLWDVLNVARWTIKVRGKKNEHILPFVVKIGRRNVKLYAAIDTTSGPAIHIMTPSEY